MSESQSQGLYRRELLRRTAGVATGATIAGAGVTSLEGGPIGNAQALACGGLCIAGAAGVAGGIAIGYLINEGADKYLGDTRDYSGYTGADALETEVYAGAVEMASADERVMTSISNNIVNSDNVALAEGKNAAIEAMNAGAGQTTAQDNMQAAIDGYFATIQQNLLTHANTQVEQFVHMANQLANHSNTSPAAMLDSSNSPTTGSEIASVGSIQTYDHTLLDGSTATYKVASFTTGGGSTLWFDWLKKTGNNYGNVFAKDPSSSDITRMLSVDNRYGWGTTPDSNGPAWNALLAKRDDVNATLSGFIADVYSAYEPGDIPTEDLVDPVTAATELSQNYDGMQGQGAYAAMLGIPTSAQQAVDITIRPNTDDSRDVTCDIYTDYTPPSGQFESGVTYDPANWDKPLYIAYEYTEETTDSDGNTTIETGSDFVQLEDPFFIRSIVEADGTQVNSFAPESRNTQTADVQALQEELAQIRETQMAMQEEAEDSGGGGGFSLGNLANGSTGMVALAAAGVLALLAFGNN